MVVFSRCTDDQITSKISSLNVYVTLRYQISKQFSCIACVNATLRFSILDLMRLLICKTIILQSEMSMSQTSRLIDKHKLTWIKGLRRVVVKISISILFVVFKFFRSPPIFQGNKNRESEFMLAAIKRALKSIHVIKVINWNENPIKVNPNTTSIPKE